jgi:hypothetical protein
VGEKRKGLGGWKKRKEKKERKEKEKDDREILRTNTLDVIQRGSEGMMVKRN